MAILEGFGHKFASIGFPRKFHSRGNSLFLRAPLQSHQFAKNCGYLAIQDVAEEPSLPLNRISEEQFGLADRGHLRRRRSKPNSEWNARVHTRGIGHSHPARPSVGRANRSRRCSVVPPPHRWPGPICRTAPARTILFRLIVYRWAIAKSRRGGPG